MVDEDKQAPIMANATVDDDKQPQIMVNGVTSPGSCTSGRCEANGHSSR